MLWRQCNQFPDKEVKSRPPTEQLSNSDMKWNSIAHAQAKNPMQAASVAKATGTKICSFSQDPDTCTLTTKYYVIQQ